MIEPEEELNSVIQNNTEPEAIVSEVAEIIAEQTSSSPSEVNVEPVMETPEPILETVEATPNTEDMVKIEKKPKAKKAVVKKTEEVASENNIEEISEIEEIEHPADFDGDFTNFSKKEFVDLAGKMLDSMNSRTLSSADVKNVDAVLKVGRQAFDEINAQEKIDAKKDFITKNGTEDGFEYKNDNYTLRFEGILIQIREKRHSFYQKLEREKEDYFEVKTRLLQSLREIIESEEKGEAKNSWDAFKKLQNEWKQAGNVSSPHNGTLWSTYNALVDRYFDNRSIQNELKDLDRKKNLINKEGVVIKIEAIAENLKETALTNVLLKKSNELLNEYKAIGPGVREEQDLLWARLKAAFDVIYEKKRDLSSENNSLQEETFNAKNILLNNIKELLNFNSDSINEWNAKSKEVMDIQEQWNAIKGPLPKDKGRDISKDFWNALKLFFKNKSEFFHKLESKKEANYKAKEELCVAAEEIVAKADLSAPNTNAIIDLQKKWKTIGQVPDKFKDTLYDRFKAACDQYFNLKRDENKSQDAEYDKNLIAKNAICDEIEKAVAGGITDFAKLAEFKKSFNAIGFVPKKDMQNIQNRFIKAINSLVKTSSGVEGKDKERMMLQNEAEVVHHSGGNSKNLDKQEGDIRRRIKSLEEEITLTKNNLEFFGFSKNAEKLKEEYMKKVIKGEAELQDLKDKLKVIKSGS
jgi:Domain of Unknown Function (DUF349)